MPSPAQIRANRANAQKSTGPKTTAGKASASQNARTHGLTAARVVTQGDFTNDYQEVLDRFMDNYKPFDFQEEVLVQQIADSWHRIGRCREIETSTIDLGATQFFCQHNFDEKPAVHSPHNERLALGYAFEKKGAQLLLINRYETAIERSYYRAVQQLARMQTLRNKQEKLTGSVSQNHDAANRPQAPPVEHTRVMTAVAEPPEAPSTTPAPVEAPAAVANPVISIDSRRDVSPIFPV